MFVDSHCHLTFPDLLDTLPDRLAAMKAAQVDRALCVNTTLEEFPAIVQLIDAHDELWGSVGVHPDNEGVTEPTVQDLVDRSRHPKVLAIGETGLDYYRLNGRRVEDMAWQRDRFRVHIEAAKQTGLPLIIHTRSSSADTLSILAEEGASHGVFHCFTETMAVARAALDMGFYISFSGIVSFKNAEELREVAAYVPLDRCLIETDSPYLAPAPFRGKVNQPAYVPRVAQCLADIRGLNLAEVAEATTANFHQLFTLSKQ